ncbi:MAG: transporter [Myxococcaceae bacterium]|nr:transporter [Myxococcaceae bacterium]
MDEVPQGAASSRLQQRRALAWLLSLAVLVLYGMLPDPDSAPAPSRDYESSEEGDRLEILDVSPLEPYPGSSIIVTHNGKADEDQIHVYAGKSELPVLARHPGEIVARLPGDVPAGDLKLRLASAEISKPYHLRSLRTKPFHVRVKTPNWRKVFRSLIGGVALVAFGMALMARGVRASTGLSAARAVTRMAQHRSVAYALGALTGGLAQSTTGAAGILAALAASSLLPLLSSAIAFLGAQLGATIAPLLVTGLVEPREGLVAVTIGILWLGLAADRRSAALGRLVLGAGFVAYGLQLFRPGLEPYLSDPILLAWGDSLRADSAYEVAACAAIGSLLVAALQGPAPLIVLILGVAQTTGRWHLMTALALLAGTGLGAAIAALLTTSGTPRTRKLARLNLLLGAASTVLAASSAFAFSAGAQALLGERSIALHWTRRVPLSELGSELALAFVPSQVLVALVLGVLAPRLLAWLERRERTRALQSPARPRVQASDPEVQLAQVLALQQGALDHIAVLAQAGARGFGQRAEHALAQARHQLEQLLGAGLNALHGGAHGGEASLGAAGFSCFQLQHSLESLLAHAERVTEAQLDDTARLPWDDDLVLRELHVLVSEGLSATRSSLQRGEPLDLDFARAREIKINRLEANARGVLLEADATPQLVQRQLHVLQVIDAYEVVGNQVYRLAESVGQGRNLQSVA